ncbi:hypothetical protein K490DRAFT_67377 [Saccharata proteae CBS 121410]|uniref:Uncharacterized protein n=1 Tax=Saccharata proteae CBS 121410 TaxID=1314787 RepID=A0A9P4HQ22_9PEZI|nr:hypothetical protein K490DRAFT_67377 [Saccharata proteae CBS 121410]
MSATTKTKLESVSTPTTTSPYLPHPPSTIPASFPFSSNNATTDTTRDPFYPNLNTLPTSSSPFLHIARQLQLHPFLIEEAAALANATSTSAPTRKPSPAIATSAPVVRHLGVGRSNSCSYMRPSISPESSTTSSPATSPGSVSGGGAEVETACPAYQCVECGRGKPMGRRFCCAAVPVWEVLFRGKLDGTVVRD